MMNDTMKSPETIQLRQTTSPDPDPTLTSSTQTSQTSSLSKPLPPIPEPGDLRISQTITQSKEQAKWWLRTQAVLWRAGMRIGMRIHDWAPPPPPKPSFHRYVSTKDLNGKDTKPIDLVFYVPKDYYTRKQQGHLFPVVVNYHGGGFVLGAPTDDRYWFRVVTAETNAVVVSVGYRRAPEHPFPSPVDDCVDSLLYLSAHALDLSLDTTRVVLSGFSAGANFTFAVPMRLKYHTQSFSRRGKSICVGDSELSRFDSTKRLLLSSGELNIVGIVAWYPLVDFATSRDAKRAVSLKPEKTMPKFFTDLFDQSYLPGSATINHSSPYVSPGLAPNHMLRGGLPHSIQIFTCEYDMLFNEGQAFANKLRSLGKDARDVVIEKEPHGWDKSPKPWRDQEGIDRYYRDACQTLTTLFEETDV